MADTTTTTTAAKIRTLGPGVLKSTDSKLTIDLSSDVTKVSLTPSNSSDDPINYLDGSQEINTSTSWTLAVGAGRQRHGGETPSQQGYD